MEKIIKYRFDLIYSSTYMLEASELMKKLDLDIGEIGIKESFIFTTQNDIAIQEIKEKIKEVFEQCNLFLIFIEGGKIE